MSSDPFGADSPRGDHPEPPDVPTSEELLGLGGAEQELDPEALQDFTQEDGAALESPTEEDFLSALPGADADLEQPYAGLEGEDDSASWLMEFDLDDDDFDPEEALDEALRGTGEAELAPAGAGVWIGRALIAAVSVAMGVVGAKYLLPATPQGPAPVQVGQAPPAQPGATAQPESGGANTNTTEPGPAVAGAEAPGAPGGAAKPGKDDRTGLPRVAKNDPSVEPQPVVVGPSGATTPTVEPGPATTDPAPAGEQPPVVASSDPGVPTIEIDWDPAGGERAPRMENPVPENRVQLDGEQNAGLREASPDELAGVWNGATIPMEALRRPQRMLTPGVGRVRVILAKGEVFEGRLYAVGQRKLWLETELGKMALVDWQIDRIEHIVAADGTTLAGGDSSRDLNGLPNVRVRTAGGVFYGKMLARDGDSVVLVTESGGRVTLDGADVEIAGRSATHVVDASGAQPAPADAPAQKP